MRQKILLIEDDENIIELVTYNLEKNGFEVHAQRDGSDVKAVLKRVHPHLVLLDVMLPDVDGFEVCKLIRREPGFQSTPILFLTARSEEFDKVLGLELGADDYITKPFSTRELVARVKAHLRRAEKAETASVVSCGAITLNRDVCSVDVEGQRVDLTAMEFKLLEFFLSHPSRVFSRDQLLDSVWGTEAFVTPRTVDVHVRRLREKIEKDARQPAYLRTVRGFGYKFEVET
jgi:phosphate regulon transcriptional regulator PhoB